MNNRYISIILTVIAVNPIMLTVDRVVSRFVPNTYAAVSPVQKVTICDSLAIKCANISNLVQGSLLVKRGK